LSFGGSLEEQSKRLLVFLTPHVLQLQLAFPPLYLSFSIAGRLLSGAGVMDFLAFYATIATVAVAFSFYVFARSEMKDAENKPMKLVPQSETPSFWERVTWQDIEESWVLR
jgi:hypothetical protein